MVYRIRFPVGEDGFGSVLVSNSMLKHFGVDKEQLQQKCAELSEDYDNLFYDYEQVSDRLYG